MGRLFQGGPFLLVFGTEILRRQVRPRNRYDWRCCGEKPGCALQLGKVSRPRIDYDTIFQRDIAPNKTRNMSLLSLGEKLADGRMRALDCKWTSIK
jgi:hypothetical protein